MIYRAKKEDKLTSQEMAVYDDFGFSEKFARLLFIRGIDTREKIESYFDFSLENLHDPFLLKGMREAVDRIEAAIQKKEKILIIGDYDADGICSVAILYKYFLSRHTPTRYFLPDRTEDGYGLNMELIEKLHKRFSPKLIITVDCGISCYDEIELAKSLGMDCIVTDHHAIPEKTPDCICINPKFNNGYPFTDLCGAGVALKLVHAIGGIEAASRYFDICSIATVADIVALRDENRIITHHGLQRLSENSLPSITALAKTCNIHGAIRSSDISYKLGPRINASGRMGNAKRGLDVVLEQKPEEIEKIIQSLTNYNVQRQKLCNTIFEEVHARVEENKLYNNNIILVADERWESGVLGIVAARITEKYGKPSIIFGKTENLYKGSGRSIEDINMVETLSKFSDLLLSFGGHSMAAGLSVAVDKYEEFEQKIIDYLNKDFQHTELKPERFYDFSIDIDEITLDLVREFERIEPTGCENPVPSFMTTLTNCNVGTASSYFAHLRFSYRGVQFMFFNGSAMAEIAAYNFPKKVVFEFQKLDETGAVRAIVKSLLPVPTDEKSYALCLSGHLNEHFCIEGDMKFNAILSKLNCDRDIFVEYYKLIRSAVGSRAFSVYDLYHRIRAKLDAEIDCYQFIFCAVVFQQLGVLSIRNAQVQVSNNISTDLFASRAYNMVRERGVVKVDITQKTLA